MVDFIDPTLRSSAASRQGQKSAFMRFLLGLLCIVGGALIIWTVYVLYTARIDTKPEQSINVDERFNTIKVEGRIPAIPTTVGSSSNSNKR